MRVAYVSMDQGVPVFGQKGCSVHVQEMITAFLNKGLDVDLFTTRMGGDRLKGFEKVNIYELPLLKSTDHAAQELNAIHLNALLEKQLMERGDYDLVYERYSLWSFAAMRYAALKRIPGILEVNAPLIEEQKQHRILIRENEAKNIAEEIFVSAAAVIAVSGEVASYVRSFNNKSISKNVYVIPNAVNPQKFCLSSADVRKKEKADFTVGFVGTLKPWHGVENLIEAFSRFYKNCPNARLLIIGDGPLKNDLIHQAERKGLMDAIQFAGAVSPDRIPYYLSLMDVAVAPYPALEGFYFSPLKVFEYMAAGLAVVASDIGQIRDVVSHQKNGWLTQAGNIDELVNAFQELHHNEVLRQSIGQSARQLILEKYTWDNVVNQIMNISKEYTKLVCRN